MLYSTQVEWVYSSRSNEEGFGQETFLVTSQFAMLFLASVPAAMLSAGWIYYNVQIQYSSSFFLTYALSGHLDLTCIVQYRARPTSYWSRAVSNTVRVGTWYLSTGAIYFLLENFASSSCLFFSCTCTIPVQATCGCLKLDWIIDCWCWCLAYYGSSNQYKYVKYK